MAKNKFKLLAEILAIAAVNVYTFTNISKVIDELSDTPVEENLRVEKVNEYKKIFLNNQKLKLVFSEKEIGEKLDQKIEGIYFSKLEENVLGSYNTKDRKIRVTKESFEKYFESILYHEITHALFARENGDTGLREIVKGGRGLNEGATEYITIKLIEATNYEKKYTYDIHVDIISDLCIAYGENIIFKALKDGPEILKKQFKEDGMSYEELAKLLDEICELEANEEAEVKHRELSRKAKNFTDELLTRRFKKSNIEEKLEMAKRVRKIAKEVIKSEQALIENLDNYYTKYPITEQAIMEKMEKKPERNTDVKYCIVMAEIMHNMKQEKKTAESMEVKIEEVEEEKATKKLKRRTKSPVKKTDYER